MRKEVPKIYINLTQDIYKHSSTSIKSMCRIPDDFYVLVGVHQGFALSPYLFSVIMNEVTG